MYINKYNLEGKLLCAFYSKEMCIFTEHLTNSELSNVLEGRRQHIFGFRYKLFINRNTKDLKPLKQVYLKNRTVYIEDKVGIIYFGSIKDCANHFKVHPSTISKMLSGERTNKYNVKYAETK
jgi:uncharacterized Fe-S cluster-containing radical SAM superfamily enzyme